MSAPNWGMIRSGEPLAAQGSQGSRHKITGVILPAGSNLFVGINSAVTTTSSVAFVAIGYTDDGAGNRVFVAKGGVATDAGNQHELFPGVSAGEAVLTLWITNLASTGTAFDVGIDGLMQSWGAQC